MMTHPSQRFDAPSTIQRGIPLKELFGRKVVVLIGESLAEVVPGFDRNGFKVSALRNLNKLELKDRARHIAHAMAEQMPANFDVASPLLIKSLGPELKQT